jgi:hypothetical protein
MASTTCLVFINLAGLAVPKVFATSHARDLVKV